MAEKQFKMKIKLGNAVMRSRVDISMALQKVAHAVQQDRDSGIVLDEWGNNVGTWEVS
jgi:hypothetical protein